MPHEKTSSAEEAYSAIHAFIVQGDYQAGDRLREEELGQRIGMSRTPIREALRRLSAEGLTEFVPNRGAHVASWTDQELNEIFELRALLEGYAASRAATRMTSESHDKLRMLSAAMEMQISDDGEPNLEQISVLNNDFHKTIVQNAGSQYLLTFFMNMIQFPLVHRTFRRYSPRDLERSFGHHRELVEAFEAQDPEWAGSVMRAHVLSARSAFVESED